MCCNNFRYIVFIYVSSTCDVLLTNLNVLIWSLLAVTWQSSWIFNMLQMFLVKKLEFIFVISPCTRQRNENQNDFSFIFSVSQIIWQGKKASVTICAMFNGRIRFNSLTGNIFNMVLKQKLCIWILSFFSSQTYRISP